jgi:hypothetical protein
VVADLQEQLLDRERELDSQKGAIIAWEESLLVSARALRETSAGCEASRAHIGAAQCHYLAQVGASGSQSERRKALHQGLDDRVALLGLQEMDLEVCVAIVVEELERSLRYLHRRDLPVKLYKARTRANEIASDRVAKAERLSRQLMRVAGVLIDLGLPPIEDIPQLPKTVRDALTVVALVLERLQGALDSGASPWD